MSCMSNFYILQYFPLEFTPENKKDIFSMKKVKYPLSNFQRKTITGQGDTCAYLDAKGYPKSNSHYTSMSLAPEKFNESSIKLQNKASITLPTSKTSQYKANFTSKCKRLTHKSRVTTQATNEAAGYDVYSDQTLHLPPHQRTKISTGLSLHIHLNIYAQISSKSGLVLNQEIYITGGVIDPEYTGIVYVILLNNSNKTYTVKQGDNIAHIVFHKIDRSAFDLSSPFTSTFRNTQGL